MTDLIERPIVIGTGIGGLATSHYLSKHGIAHVLIGRRPDQCRPRLGESLDLVGSLQIQLEFPQYGEFFHPKDNIGFYRNNHAAVVCANLTGPLIKLLCRFMGVPLLPLVHLDRVGFDSVFYDDVVRASECFATDSAIVRIEADRENDRVTDVRLDDGSHFRPAFLFDASGSGTQLSDALHMARSDVGVRQHVAFTHYLAGAARPCTSGPGGGWKHATSLVRLLAEHDEIDGIGWAIPLGDYISIGTNVNAACNDHSDAELIRLADAAFERRGVHYMTEFNVPTQVRGFPYTHSRTQRLCGTNWVQAGNASNQIWFTASSAVGTSLVVAKLAPLFLKRPRQATRVYRQYVESLWRSHRFHESIFVDPIPDSDSDASQQLAADVIGFISGNEDRYLLNARAFAHHNMSEAALRLLTETFKANAGRLAVFARRYLRVAQVDDLAAQEASLYSVGIPNCQLSGHADDRSPAC